VLRNTEKQSGYVFIILSYALPGTHIMAGKQRPELKDMMNALADLSWEEFTALALQLDVKKATLDKIEEDKKRAEGRKLEAMDQWLKQDVDASWEKIVDALETVKMNTLAGSVRAKYCPPRRPPVPRT